MKTFKLSEVEKFLQREPAKKLKANISHWFRNTNIYDGPDKVEEAGRDIYFVHSSEYFDVELRRFPDDAGKQTFKCTTFIETAEQALEVVRAFTVLETILEPENL